MSETERGLPNLASSCRDAETLRQIDKRVEGELRTAGIEIIDFGRCIPGEVPTRHVGKIGGFVLTRAWHYWIARAAVQGYHGVPLATARKLYYENGAAGKCAIRVAGHCACPPPDEWVETISGEQYVTCYHIDTQEGLDLFAATIRKEVISPD